MTMLFNSLEDIKQDIINKVDEHLKELYNKNPNGIPDSSTKDIIALISNYVWQLKVKKELSNYQIILYKQNTIKITILNDSGDSLVFNINLDIELRKIKIIKIKDKKT